MKTLLALLILFGATACGIKAPPVAPQRAPDPLIQNLDCSPKDEDCDAVDPDYGR